MFLATFGLKEWSLLDWVSKAKPCGMAPSQATVNSERRMNRPVENEAKQILIKFLDMLPKLPSHIVESRLRKCM